MGAVGDTELFGETEKRALRARSCSSAMSPASRSVAERPEREDSSTHVSLEEEEVV